MRRKIFNVTTAVVALVMVFAACDDKKNNGSNNGGINSLVIDAKNVIDGSSDITTVKAIIYGEDDDYIVASGEYKNNGFKLDLSKAVPDKYLECVGDIPASIVVSDKNAKVTNLEIHAYNSSGDEIGTFYFEDVNEIEATYIYADRNFTIKGEYTENYEDYTYTMKFDCSFKKGWNLIYSKSDVNASGYTSTMLTQKPAGINYRWVYYEYGDYAKQKSKSHFPKLGKK